MCCKLVLLLLFVVAAVAKSATVSEVTTSSSLEREVGSPEAITSAIVEAEPPHLHDEFFTVAGKGTEEYGVAHRAHGILKSSNTRRLTRTTQGQNHQPQGIVVEADAPDSSSDRRRLNAVKREIYIRNDCVQAVDAKVAFKKKKKKNGIKYKSADIAPGQTTLLIKKLKQTSFWVWGESTSFIWEGQPSNSEVCNSERCYRRVDIDPSFTSYTFIFLCNGAPTPTPPTPTPPTPTPPTPTPPTPTPPTGGGSAVTGQDKMWLDGHNFRRQKYHQKYGVSFKALKWSEELAESAQRYTEALAKVSNCYIAHGHNGDRYGGENLAANWGGSATPAAPDGVLTRWTEDEEFVDFFANGHFSQVLWRGSNYVGCGQTQKRMPNGGFCHIQACRYLSPGNCNINANTQFQKMVEASSPCIPECPLEEGCF